MKSTATLALCCLALAFAQSGWTQQAARAGQPRKEKPMLAHNVYFSLEDNSQSARQDLVEACHKYLAPIPGIVFYAAGTLSDVDRPVNDRDYDVALHVVFKNRAALDDYLVAPGHLEFVEKYKHTWTKVRVFDSLVTGAPK